MIIIRDVFGGIIINPVNLYVDNLYVDGNSIMAGSRDYSARISEYFETRGEADEALDWIFDQMNQQCGNPNIFIDMKERKFLMEGSKKPV